jgi:NADH-quinone oxidoreductase subunit L
MEEFYTIVPLVVFIPLLGMVLNLFFGKSIGERGVSYIAVGASSLAFLVSLLLWVALANSEVKHAVIDPPILRDWIKIPSAAVDIPWQMRVDTLSVTMMLVVTGVGSLIHLYAVGYMHGDSRFPRFFVYLNLFLVFMLVLVTGNNFLMMFVGWEGVGLCSYLLIGFWFDKSKKVPVEGTEGWKNSNAARKAFIVNRVGDFGLLMGIFLTFWTFGTLDFYKADEDIMVLEEHGEETEAGVFTVEELKEDPFEGRPRGVFAQAELWFEEGGHEVEFGSINIDFEDMIVIITLFFVLGVTGKSAQIPLFVWLPDAMAGPTPVSALIHAATMVTAGIYLMVRSNSFFYHAEVTSFVVTLVGVGTALVAGFIALGQWDIKKVLAYSTVSQLGFMVAAVGLGAYVAAMFHLVTHAVFKALLFLASGSVIHGVEHGHHHVHEHGHGDEEYEHEEDFDPQDMRNMGGLRHRMPVTYWTYVAGALALAGVIPFAGFWSKDEILVDAFEVGFTEGEFKGYLALAILFVAAAFTAFYIWRQVSLVFYGEPRTEAAEHAPESVRTMTLPLAVLGVGTLLIGMINVPAGFPLLDVIFGEARFKSWLGDSLLHIHGAEFNWILAILATAVALGAIYLARTVYSDKVTNAITEEDPLELDPQYQPIFALSKARLYWDEAYFAYIVVPYQRMADFVGNTLDWKWWHDFFHENIIYQGFIGATDLISNPLDRRVIDDGFMGIARLIRTAGGYLRRIQTGYVRTYAFSVLFGVLLVIFIILFPSIVDWLGL